MAFMTDDQPDGVGREEGTWRPIGPDEILPAGRNVRMNIETGQSELLEPVSGRSGNGRDHPEPRPVRGRRKAKVAKGRKRKAATRSRAPKQERKSVDPAAMEAAVERLMALSSVKRGYALPIEAEKLGPRCLTWLKEQVKRAEKEQAELIKLSKRRPKGTGSRTKREADDDGVLWPQFYTMTDDGLFYQPAPKDGDEDEDAPPPLWLSAPFRVLGATADSVSSTHGLLLEWFDNRESRHTWAVPRKLMHIPGNEIAAELDNAGLFCNNTLPAHEKLKVCLGALRSERQIRCVERAGWHDAAYVLPTGQVFGGDALVMQSGNSVALETYAARGTLEEWKQGVAHYAIGNDRLMVSISAGFVAPLLVIVNVASGGAHFAGQSQIGKTTMQQCTGSIWGPGEPGRQVRGWRATANGLEGVAAERCDGVLTLDDTSTAEDPKDVVTVVYMLANQQGKARANRTGAAVPPLTWRVMVISSGEKTIAATLAEAKKRLPAGAAVRMLDIPADAGVGHGVWQVLHGHPNGAALSNHLRVASTQYCGVAGPLFLEKLVALRQRDPEALAAKLRDSIARFIRKFVPKGADGQVQSAAERMGLIAAAGELAVAFGLLPWPKGAATAAAAACFRLWLDVRGGTEAAEDIAALRGIRTLLSSQGARFAPAQKPAANSYGDPPELPRIRDQLGYVSMQGDAIDEYWVLASLWQEVCAGFGIEPGKVTGTLRRKGYLLGATDKYPADVKQPWGRKSTIRVYRIDSVILAGAAANEADDQQSEVEEAPDDQGC
jgi:uncharacterized protein (DUF927 family)